MMTVLLLVFAYLIGSIPTGLIVGKQFWQTDLRNYGSKNIGATNAWRVLGKKAGITIFLLDFLKGVLPTALALNFLETPLEAVLVGALAIVGHSCSIFLKFKGGKSVSTGLGVILALMPTVTVIVFISWLIIVKYSGYVSLASIIASLLVPILSLCFGEDMVYTIFGVLIAIFIIYRHKANIERLRAGTESKIVAHK